MTGDSKAKKLDGMACDLLETSALVDPLKFVPADVQELLSSSTSLFPGTGLERCQPGKIPAADRDQYSLLVLRQLRSGKVRPATGDYGRSVYFPDCQERLERAAGGLQWIVIFDSRYSTEEAATPSVSHVLAFSRGFCQGTLAGMEAGRALLF